jgi:hypothetical protein
MPRVRCTGMTKSENNGLKNNGLKNLLILFLKKHCQQLVGYLNAANCCYLAPSISQSFPKKRKLFEMVFKLNHFSNF